MKGEKTSLLSLNNHIRLPPPQAYSTYECKPKGYTTSWRRTKQGGEWSRGAQTPRPPLKYAWSNQRDGDSRRANARSRPPPTSQRFAGRMADSLLHLSQWKPKRTTTWIVPRFDPGKERICSSRSLHPSLCSTVLACTEIPLVQTDDLLSTLPAPPKAV